MSTQDILNIFLILALFVFITCMMFITFFLVQTLKALKSLAEHLKDTTQSIQDKVGLKVLAAVPSVMVALIGRILRKRG